MPLTRRQFLQASGGITFLGLVPISRQAFAAAGVSPLRPAPPIFTALPYIQPGNASKLIQDQESLVIVWQTEPKEADFKVEVGSDKKYGRTVDIERASQWSGDTEDGENRFLYSAPVTGLKLGTRYQYRVTCNGTVILEGYFTTRQPRGTKTRFVSFGDNSFGDISDRAIAYQAYRANPDFVMNTGDVVYDGGLVGEYERFFFPVYNAESAGPRIGAPLLRSMPFYAVIANHDVHDKDTAKNPVADFTKNPDSFGYFTQFHLPLNGPTPAQIAPAVGNVDRIAAFKTAAGARYPNMTNYSFDSGDLHFLCLDSNIYVDPTNADLQRWIAADLAATDAAWKVVVYHHPAFNVGEEHYREQHMRVLCPIFEKNGVDLVLNGHEHSYQRPRPFHFVPGDITRASVLNTKDRLVPGEFHQDRKFDGVKETRPDGVLYITTGAGGKHLYDGDWNGNPQKWKWKEDKFEDYAVKFVSDRHSLTVLDVEAHRLEMKQIDEFGAEIDRILITKA